MTAEELYKEIGDYSFGIGKAEEEILLGLYEDVDTLRITFEQYKKGWVPKIDVEQEMAKVQIGLFRLMQKMGINYVTYVENVRIRHWLNLKKEG